MSKLKIKDKALEFVIHTRIYRFVVTITKQDERQKWENSEALICGDHEGYSFFVYERPNGNNASLWDFERKMKQYAFEDEAKKLKDSIFNEIIKCCQYCIQKNKPLLENFLDGNW